MTTVAGGLAVDEVLVELAGIMLGGAGLAVGEQLVELASKVLDVGVLDVGGLAV